MKHEDILRYPLGLLFGLFLLLANPAFGASCSTKVGELKQHLGDFFPSGATVLKLEARGPEPLLVERAKVWAWQGNVEIEVSPGVSLSLGSIYLRQKGDVWRNLAAILGCDLEWIDIENVWFELPAERPAHVSSRPPAELKGMERNIVAGEAVAATLVPIYAKVGEDSKVLEMLPAGTRVLFAETFSIAEPARARVVYPRLRYRPGDEFWILHRTSPGAFRTYFGGRQQELELPEGCQGASHKCWFQLETLPREVLWTRIETAPGVSGWVRDPAAFFGGAIYWKAKDFLASPWGLTSAVAADPWPRGPELDDVAQRVAAMAIQPPWRLSELQALVGPFRIDATVEEYDPVDPRTPRFAAVDGLASRIRIELSRISEPDPRLRGWEIDFLHGRSAALSWLTEHFEPVQVATGKNRGVELLRFGELFFEALPRNEAFRISWNRHPAEVWNPGRNPEETRVLLDWVATIVESGFSAATIEDLHREGLIFEAGRGLFVLRGPTWTLELDSLKSKQVPYSAVFRFHAPLPGPEVAKRLGILQPGIYPVPGSISDFPPGFYLASPGNAGGVQLQPEFYSAVAVRTPTGAGHGKKQPSKVEGSQVEALYLRLKSAATRAID